QGMRVIEAGETPFRWWRVVDLVERDSLRSAAANVPPNSWPGWVRYSNDIERGKRTTRRFDVQHYAISYLSREVNDQIVASALASLIGLDVNLSPDPESHGAGLHVTDPGGWLQVHVDYE